MKWYETDAGQGVLTALGIFGGLGLLALLVGVGLWLSGEG